MNSFDRIPPNSAEAEKALLGAIISRGMDVYTEVSDIIAKDQFYTDAHRIIYEAILRLVQKHKTIDLITVIEELRQMKHLEDVGGINYVTNISNMVFVGDNHKEHAFIIREKAQLRKLIAAGDRIVMNCYAGEEEAQDIIKEAENLVLSVRDLVKSTSSFAAMSDIVLETMNHMYELNQRKTPFTGIPTCFRQLDKITNGLHKSDLILVAARPSMGKTAFTLNIAQNVALRDNKRVAFFSLEMSKEQLVSRILASASQVPLGALRTGQLTTEQWKQVTNVVQYLEQAQLYIDDTPGLTGNLMQSKLKRLVADVGPLDLIVVDYVQLMQGNVSRGNSDNRQQEISEISRSLKLIARQFDVPVIALSQLSRGVEARSDKRPLLSDLRESGSLEQDADIVIFLYRDKYYNPDAPEDETEVIIRKHRNGELGTVKLIFKGEYTRFFDKALNEEEAPAPVGSGM